MATATKTKYETGVIHDFESDNRNKYGSLPTKATRDVWLNIITKHSCTMLYLCLNNSLYSVSNKQIAGKPSVIYWTNSFTEGTAMFSTRLSALARTDTDYNPVQLAIYLYDMCKYLVDKFDEVRTENQGFVDDYVRRYFILRAFLSDIESRRYTELIS